MRKTYDKYGVRLHESRSWATRRYRGYKPEGVGDYISRSMNCDYDNGSWKYGDVCYDLLKVNKRWPNDLNDSAQCRTIIASAYWKTKWHVCKWIEDKFGICKNWTCKYRSQNDMTRDPYIYFYAAAFVNSKMDKIKNLKIPFRLRRPEITHWRKYLLTGKKIHLNIYLLIQGKTKLEFVQRMNKVKHECVIMKLNQTK